MGLLYGLWPVARVKSSSSTRGQAVAIRSALELTTSYKARLLRGGFFGMAAIGTHCWDESAIPEDLSRAWCDEGFISILPEDSEWVFDLAVKPSCRLEKIWA